MIALQRRKDGIPAKFQGAGLAAEMAKLLDAYFVNNRTVPYSTQKSLEIWGKSKPNLKKESFNKCAYCESPTATVAHGDVEHFRPKSIYWWLAYSYDNYTYACQICNQTHKSDNFLPSPAVLKPPKIVPAARPSDAKLAELATQLCPDPATSTQASLNALWRREKAHLPHPYVDDPEALLAWEADDINREVVLVARPGKPKSTQAVLACESILGLNRLELKQWRYPQYEHIHVLAEVLQSGPNATISAIVKKSLAEAARDDRPYAGMTRYFLRQWGVLA